MAALDLPEGPAQLLEAVRRPLAVYLGGERHIHLGGGTALAARWQHRHSTDVDLFVDPAAYKMLFENEERFRLDLKRHLHGVLNVSIEPGFARILDSSGGEVSVSTSPTLTENPVSADLVRGTLVPLETTGEILAKKLRYRMIGNGLLVPRDLYDIGTANELDFDGLQSALRTLRKQDLDDIATELRYLRPNWMRLHRQPLIDPTNQELAVNAVKNVRSLVLQHRRLRN